MNIVTTVQSNVAFTSIVRSAVQNADRRAPKFMFGHDLIDTAANWSGHGKCHTVAKVHPWTREIKIRSKIASGGMATLDNG
ncbi:hypothetical protein T4B_7023 [Trichinella pseudospiralis]|uniref:Uncharacterized protein n=1 Tax=Trichinella pseudospiralis TaxID=6337 RepID=A0A0V1EHI2_TRIPS|nr:hypothetical protein T4A_352 [Trichinella pseudospiralis]KRZ23141.1 hypothetical protein T4B_7023 [Trichinella pseudospiralis]KRZ29174.1 hypothetical protein T4C_1453 [Trichinella pseudospiralis]